MKDTLGGGNFKDPFGPKGSKGSFKENTKALVKGAVTLAIALPLLGALTGAIGGNN